MTRFQMRVCWYAWFMLFFGLPIMVLVSEGEEQDRWVQLFAIFFGTSYVTNGACKLDQLEAKERTQDRRGE